VAAAVAVPALGALAHWSFTTEERPSAVAGIAFIAMAVMAAFAFIGALRFRIDLREDGLVVQSAFGPSRTVRWDDIQRVELIAQASDGNTITRWRAEHRHVAFHVVIHAKGGRVNVNRWMNGVDDLLDALDRANVLEREKAAPVFRPEEPVTRAVSAASKGLDVVQTTFVGVAVFGLTWVAAFVFAGNAGDATLLALAPIAVFAGLLRIVRVVRARRFGPTHARVPLSMKDAVYLYGTVLGAGPLTYYGVKLAGTEGMTSVSGFCLVVGLLFCWFVIRDVRALLRDP